MVQYLNRRREVSIIFVCLLKRASFEKGNHLFGATCLYSLDRFVKMKKKNHLLSTSDPLLTWNKNTRCGPPFFFFTPSCLCCAPFVPLNKKKKKKKHLFSLPLFCLLHIWTHDVTCYCVSVCVHLNKHLLPHYTVWRAKSFIVLQKFHFWPVDGATVDLGGRWGGFRAQRQTQLPWPKLERSSSLIGRKAHKHTFLSPLLLL